MNEFIRRFREQAAQRSEHIALSVHHQEEFTYAQLAMKVHQYSLILKGQGIKPGHLVALHQEKSAEYLICLLAVWSVGAAFVPVDPTLPQARQDYFLQQTRPNLILHGDKELEFCHNAIQYPENLAYIIFTSGSTGQPKAVLVPHTGLMNVLDQQIELFALGPKDRALFYLSTQFDASISDLGTTLLSGATLCFVPADQLALATNLTQILKELEITHIDLPPSLLKTLDSATLSASLKTIMIGGEACPLEVVRFWADHVRLIGIYGPTEATICTSMLQYNSPVQGYACIGKPIANIEYQIRNEQGQPAAEGELYISGPGLALGYLNNPQLTQNKFVQINSKIYYRTGDWVRFDQTGYYFYLGRMDRQSKIHGQLVAPEEIEAALCQHPAVRSAAVLFIESAQRNESFAFVEAEGVSTNILLYFLKSLLPSWMIPNHIRLVANIPKNTNGKINYSALNPHLKTQKPSAELARDPITARLQTICQHVLDLPFLPSIHDDLFQTLGANSLDIIHFIVRAELNHFMLSTELLHHLRTLYDVALWIKTKQNPARDALSSDLLKQEAQIPAHIPSCPQSTKKHIFFTGATGFLGIHLLEQILIRLPKSAQIYCLIRAKTPKQALERLINAAKRYTIDLQPYLQRIQIILGDIRKEQLGMSNTDWSSMCHNIGHIYHCAAEVNMNKTFAELKLVNLFATQEIARLANSQTRKRISYTSTLSVFVASDPHQRVYKEQDSLEQCQTIYGGYAQSKWAAEYYLSHAAPDLSIFRLGLITGHSRTGQYSTHDFLAQFVQGLRELGGLPSGDWSSICFDATPVDFAAASIAHLSLYAPRSCFHIANPRRFSLNMLLQALERQGIQLKIASNLPLLESSNPTQAISYMALCRLLPQKEQVFERFRSMDLFQATGVTFDQRRALKYLQGTGIHCPPADTLLLDTYIGKIIDAS